MEEDSGLENNGIFALYQLITEYIDVSDSELEYCLSMLSYEVYKKKDILLKEGEICSKIYFVAKGLLRIYFIDDKDEEKTFHFCLENTFGTDYESFLKGIPSSFSIQAMEDTDVLVISFEMLQNIYRELQHGEKLGRRITEEYFFLVNDKIKAIYVNAPLVRYRDMDKRFPKIHQRVPQHCIASYLNITPVHLSRLKYMNDTT
ncbi:Crp/Fnr family transcriptional regulator [Flavobacterium hibisci]|uniref:Crp/Fnr family transcriptional regulator n=1 Tax=Flavobacterium hibisci TaxID=1914462 RepID=UPI001CBE69A7|nr:Crp/Fnr family transcriptional regulator [Flavobacterium hibisci]MBZ4044598.1 Crp/Fnr family transcriptional regulator [Flavobacterium hibisci]